MRTHLTSEGYLLDKKIVKNNIRLFGNRKSSFAIRYDFVK